MIFWLDHMLFGNGRGLKTPYSDGKFYLLSGRLYTWQGWFGAQLSSWQWTHPLSGELRTLLGREFRPMHSHRKGPRVQVAWAATALPKPIDEANSFLRALQTELDRL